MKSIKEVVGDVVGLVEEGGVVLELGCQRFRGTNESVHALLEVILALDKLSGLLVGELLQAVSK